MVVIDSACCREVGVDKFLDAKYKTAVGTVTGSLEIEKKEGSMWVIIHALDATSTPDDQGNGIVSFDCGPSSNYQSGEFQYKLSLTDSEGTDSWIPKHFPADAC